MEGLTLVQYTQKIKEVFVGFSLQWIQAEIAEITLKNGHYYVDLVQKDTAGRNILAKVRATIWANNVWLLETKTQGKLKNLLIIGNKILVLVATNFHELYGFSLNIQNIDISYTIGELEMRRQKTIDTLIGEGLHEKQKKLNLQPVLQRIAVISSSTAAGYQDFVTHLQQNIYGYKFEITFFETTLQGEKAEQEIIASLEEVGEIADDFDVALLLRGGGARLDLEVFNSEFIARTIARMSVPVLTGIGHTKDQSVADFVSFESLKTPTALADFILAHNLDFEQTCFFAFQQMIQQATKQIQIATLQLQETKNSMQYLINRQTKQEEQKIIRLLDKIGFIAQQQLSKTTNQINTIENKIALLNPKNILARGYTITTVNKKLIHKETKLVKGDKIITKGLDFEIETEFTND
jgi:exodeoxyribonuclease VII large subunit